MEYLQTLAGTLNRGFIGNIIYNFNLEDSYSKLYICLTYDKEKISDPESTLKDKIEEAYEKHFGYKIDEEHFGSVLASMKTEIQLAVFINGNFAGNVHMPGTKKEMIIAGDISSQGCLPCENIQGMIKIVINIFNVLEDHTSYTLKIKGEQ
jgi:hypothetical protein